MWTCQWGQVGIRKRSCFCEDNGDITDNEDYTTDNEDYTTEDDEDDDVDDEDEEDS